VVSRLLRVKVRVRVGVRARARVGVRVEFRVRVRDVVSRRSPPAPHASWCCRSRKAPAGALRVMG